MVNQAQDILGSSLCVTTVFVSHSSKRRDLTGLTHGTSYVAHTLAMKTSNSEPPRDDIGIRVGSRRSVGSRFSSSCTPPSSPTLARIQACVEFTACGRFFASSLIFFVLSFGEATASDWLRGRWLLHVVAASFPRGLGMFGSHELVATIVSCKKSRTMSTSVYSLEASLKHVD